MAIASISGFFIGYRIIQMAIDTRWTTLFVNFINRTGSYNSYGRARLTQHDSLAGAKLDHIYGVEPGKDTVSLIFATPQNDIRFLNQCSNINYGFVTPKHSAQKNL